MYQELHGMQNDIEEKSARVCALSPGLYGEL